VHKLVIFLTACLILNGTKTKAQSPEELDQFGKQVYTWLTDSLSPENKVEFIRIRTWRNLIERQPISAAEKQTRILEAQEEYQNFYKAFMRQSALLRKTNLIEKKEGARFTFLNFKAQPLPKSKDIFTGTLRVLYNKGSVQNMVTYTFRIFYNGKGLGLITAPTEQF
jgi:predicted alternative tryptophan synthase beta-subunit